MKQYTANRMTSARIVTFGQTMAMIPTMNARMPRTMSELDHDLNMTLPFIANALSLVEAPRAVPGQDLRPMGT